MGCQGKGDQEPVSGEEKGVKCFFLGGYRTFLTENVESDGFLELDRIGKPWTVFFA